MYTYISRTMTMLAFSSKASTHWTSFGWCRQFMMPISCLIFSLSLAEYALKNFPAQTFPVFFSTSLKTCPNFPLKTYKYLYDVILIWHSSLGLKTILENLFSDWEWLHCKLMIISTCALLYWTGQSCLPKYLSEHYSQRVRSDYCSFFEVNGAVSLYISWGSAWDISRN